VAKLQAVGHPAGVAAVLASQQPQEVYAASTFCLPGAEELSADGLSRQEGATSHRAIENPPDFSQRRFIAVGYTSGEIQQLLQLLTKTLVGESSRGAGEFPM